MSLNLEHLYFIPAALGLWSHEHERSPRISRPSERLEISTGLASFALIVRKGCPLATRVPTSAIERLQLAIVDRCSLSVFLQSFIRRAFLDDITEC